MNKIWEKMLNMSLGKKIYALLWSITGIIVIAFIAVAVALDSVKGQTSKKIYELSYVTETKSQDEIKKITVDSSNLRQEIKDRMSSDTGYKAHIDSIIASVKTIGDVISTNEAAEIYDLKSVTGNKISDGKFYALVSDKAPAITLTDEAVQAQNGIAVTGLLFGVSLAGSVFTTVGVSIYEKKQKKPVVSGGKK